MRTLSLCICCCLIGAVAALAVTGALSGILTVPDADWIKYALDTQLPAPRYYTGASVLIR